CAEGAVEIIKIQRLDGGLSSQHRVPQLAPQRGREHRAAGENISDLASNPAGDATIGVHPLLIKLIEAVSSIASEQLIAALAGEDNLHLLRRQTRHKIQRDARRPSDGLVF